MFIINVRNACGHGSLVNDVDEWISGVVVFLRY